MALLTRESAQVVVFTWLAVIMLWAVVENVRAYRACPPQARAERHHSAGVAVLAAVYVVGYVVVLTGVVDVLLWSEFFRGVSLLAIPLVWVQPAVQLRRRWKADREAARVLVTAATTLQVTQRDRAS